MWLISRAEAGWQERRLRSLPRQEGRDREPGGNREGESPSQALVLGVWAGLQQTGRRRAGAVGVASRSGCCQALGGRVATPGAQLRPLLTAAPLARLSRGARATAFTSKLTSRKPLTSTPAQHGVRHGPFWCFNPSRG